MKRILSVLASVVIVFFACAQALAADTYNLGEIIPGDTEQGPRWYYVYDTGELNIRYLSYSEAFDDYGYDGVWTCVPVSEGFFAGIAAFPGQTAAAVISGYSDGGKLYRAGAQYKASETGVIEVPDFVVFCADPTFAQPDENPVSIVILHNGTEIARDSVTGGDTADGFTLPVRAGDTVTILVDPENNPNRGAIVYIGELTLSFTPGGTADPPETSDKSALIIYASLAALCMLALIVTIKAKRGAK